MRRSLWVEIQALSRDRLSIRSIARRLQLHRKTVRQALAEKAPRLRPPRRSRLDEHRGWLSAKLERYPELTATRLMEMLREERGYTGGYTVVKECVADLRPRVKPAFLTLSFAAGECAQADWGSWRTVDVLGTPRRLSFFVMVLCHSRMLYAELSLSEAQEHWLACHRPAFEFFGGVPERVMVDNCKTAVLRPGPQGIRELNPAYEQFAAHYGFKVSACNAGRPNEKGRVENAVGYLKKAFFAGREPSSLEALQPALRHWLVNTANVRMHATTGRRPAELFKAAEQRALRPLPPDPGGCATTLQVVADNRFRVTVKTNRYSVPSKFASRRLILHRYADRIVVVDPEGGGVVADHRRCYGRRQDLLLPEHERDFLISTRHKRDQRLLERFLSLGSAAEPYLTRLRERRPDWRSHAERINALAEIHGRDEVARLLADALEHQAFAADYLLAILSFRARKTAEPGPLHVTRRQDLLELTIPEPDLDLYNINDRKPTENTP